MTETVIDVNEIARKAAEEAVKATMKAQSKPQETTAVSESMVKPKTILEMAKSGEYKTKVAAALNLWNQNEQQYREMFTEAIGAVAARRRHLYPASENVAFAEAVS